MRTMTTTLTICRFMQRLYGIDVNVNMADMMRELKMQGANHLFEGFKGGAAGRQPQEYINFAESFPYSEFANGIFDELHEMLINEDDRVEPQDEG